MKVTDAKATFKKGQVVVVRSKDDKGWRGTGLWRPMTHEETRAWYASDEAKVMTDDGETKLPPQSVYKDGDDTTPYKVVVARTKARRGWHDIAGCCTVQDADSVLWFVERKDLR